MRALQIAMPDVECACQNELLRPVETERLRQMLDKCVEESENCGLSAMTMDEINAEIKAYRAEKRAMQKGELQA